MPNNTTSPEIIKIGGTELKIFPADKDADHFEEVAHVCKFTKREYRLRIWKRDPTPNRDTFRYETVKLETFSHPTLKGARNMIAKSLVSAGMIDIPEDNSHLSELNTIKLNSIAKNRSSLLTSKPIIGDIVLVDGIKKRVSNCTDFGCQTSRGGSFHVFKNGNSSFSGQLDPALLYEGFSLEPHTEAAQFWFFDASLGAVANAGRNVYIQTKVWRFENPRLTEEQCRAHKSIINFRNFLDYPNLDADTDSKINQMMLGYTG